MDARRVPADVRQVIGDQEAAVTSMAWWVARVTLAANAWGPSALRDSESAPRGQRRTDSARRRPKRGPQEVPLALGGHDIMCAREHLRRPWRCRVCHRSSATFMTIASTRCPGSVARKWALASCERRQHGFGGGHTLLLTGVVTWCWRCGANSCVRTRHLSKPCPGWPSGTLAQAKRRLLLGLHPKTRLPLRADAMHHARTRVFPANRLPRRRDEGA